MLLIPQKMRAPLFLTFLSLTASGFAETAYSALRVVGAERGEEIFQQVIEVRGDGTQEPAAWKIVVLDRGARAGVREIEVRKGRITHESTPKTAPQASGPMNLDLLNLDSEGVIDVINLETGAPTSAERINYSLSNGTASGTPVWTLKMQPPRLGTIASMEVAADTGEVLTRTARFSADQAPSSTGQIPSGETDPPQSALADGREEPSHPGEPVTQKRSSSRSREGIEDVPDAVKSVVRQVKKPIRMLRRFLP